MFLRPGHRARFAWGLVLAVAAVSVPTGLAFAARMAPAEVVTGGPSQADYLIRQADLHDRLVTLLPSGPTAAGIHFKLTASERAEFERPGRRGPGPLKIGLVKGVSPAVVFHGLESQSMSRGGAPFARGTLQATDDGGFVWAIPVTSEAAGGLRVHIAGFNLPDNAGMYILSRSGEAYGPYQRKGPGDVGDFWTNSVLDSNATILVVQHGPATPDELRSMSFVILAVGHIGRQFPKPVEQAGPGFCGNPTCVLDASCYNEPALSDAEDAVAQMEWISGPYIYTCTGGLLADTDSSSQIPYFLTANHCISRGKDAKNMEAFFFYRTQSCSSQTCPSNASFPKVMGATIRATGRGGDFTLMQLNQNPPSGTVMMGWNSEPIAFTDGADLFRISHPNFGTQAYSHHQVDTSAGTCSGWPRGERIYSHDVEGATDGGSSGSPVLNAAGQVVGQLSGACGLNPGDACDSSNATVDGALAYYFDQVSTYLDPQGGGGGGCTSNSECDDGQFCNGSETCNNGTCQSGTSPCSAGETCDETGNQCVPAPMCFGNKHSCSVNSDCCSNNCRNGSCKGN